MSTNSDLRPATRSCSKIHMNQTTCNFKHVTDQCFCLLEYRPTTIIVRFIIGMDLASGSREPEQAPGVFDAFGVRLGSVLRSEPDRILIGTPGQPALWVSRQAVLEGTAGSVVLQCSRNRLGAFTFPVDGGRPPASSAPTTTLG